MSAILGGLKFQPPMAPHSRAKHLAGAILLLLVSVLTYVPPLNSSGRARQLSPKQRLKLFDQVWRLVGEKYYDANFNGVNWNAVRDQYRPRAEAAANDENLYELLKSMTGELHDAHTRFRSPSERERAHKLQATTPGISIGEVDGKPVIVSVEAGSEAARAGVEPGTIVATVDGVSLPERLARARAEVGVSSSSRATALLSYYEVLAGEPGTTVRLGLQRDDGSIYDLVLSRHLVPIAPPITSRRLPSGYAYIKFDLFNESVAKKVSQELAQAKGAPGLIIDVRGNPGGDFDAVLRIANNFFSDRVSFGRVIARSGKRPSIVLRILGVPSELETGNSGAPVYSGPVVILVNEASGSAAEIFAAGMQENRRAGIVGRQTCGCVLASVAHSLKGGSEVDISEFGVITAKGRRLEGTGITPDVPVPLTLRDLRQQYDATLREAVAILNSSTRLAESGSGRP